MHMELTCPECGTEMVLDEGTGRLSCPECGHTEQIEGYQSGFVKYRPVKLRETFGDEEARLYICKNCGMEFITDNHSSLSECSFCGSGVNLGERLSGDLRPTKILPFKVTEKQAQKAFRKWYLKLKFSPKEFRKKRKECRCHAVYLPVWLYQMRGQGEVMIHTTKSHPAIEKDEKEKIIETDHYDLYRRFDLGFDNIPMSASGKIGQRFLEAMEPYDFTKMEEFDSYVFSGYLAEKYHCKVEDVKKQAEKKIKESMDEYLLTTVSGYEEIHIVEREYEIGEAGTEYVWLPVMFVSLEPGDSEYLFVMNGQTGKVAFDPPYSLIKILITGGLFVTFSFLLLRIIILVLGGSLL